MGGLLVNAICGTSSTRITAFTDEPPRVATQMKGGLTVESCSSDAASELETLSGTTVESDRVDDDWEGSAGVDRSALEVSFGVGDTVKVVDGPEHVGRIGIIIKLDQSQIPFLISFSGTSADWFMAEDIELIASARNTAPEFQGWRYDGDDGPFTFQEFVDFYEDREVATKTWLAGERGDLSSTVLPPLVSCCRAIVGGQGKIVAKEKAKDVDNLQEDLPEAELEPERQRSMPDQVVRIGTYSRATVDSRAPMAGRVEPPTLQRDTPQPSLTRGMCLNCPGPHVPHKCGKVPTWFDQVRALTAARPRGRR